MKKILAVIKHPIVMSAYMATAFVYVIYYIYDNWKSMSSIFASVRYDNLTYAVIFGFLNLLGLVYISFVVYGRLGARISYWNTLKVVLASRVGIYLPGRIWYVSNFYIFSRKFGLSPRTIGQSFVITNIFNFLTGGVCSLSIIFPLVSTQQKYLLIIACLFLFFLSHPWLLNRMASLFPKITEGAYKDLYFREVSSADYFWFVGSYILLWVVAGVKLYFCMAMVAPAEVHLFPIVFVANCASMILGMLAVFAPGGIGVREGVGVFILSTVIPTETAVVVMVVSRMITAAFDLLGGILAFLLFHKLDSEKKVLLESPPCEVSSTLIK